MKAKKIITSTLLAFVAVSIGYLVLSNYQSQESPISRAGITDSVTDSPVKTTDEAVPVLEDKVVAIYFHGTTRCETCKAIEAFTREALGSGFDEEIKNGKLELRAVNVDEPAVVLRCDHHGSPVPPVSRIS